MKTIYQATFQLKIRLWYHILWRGNLYWVSTLNAKWAWRTIMKRTYKKSCLDIFEGNGLLTAITIHIQESLIFAFKNRTYKENKISTEYNTRTTQVRWKMHKLSITEREPECKCSKYYNIPPNQMREKANLKVFKEEVYRILIQI